MISANKFFIIIVSIIIFIILISSSYFSKEYSIFKKPYYENNQNWLFKINLNEEKFLEKYDSKEEWVNINFINSFDKILTYNSKFEYKENNGSKEIDLWEWIYLINISELNSEYTINWEWFRIKNNWPLSVYIDTSERRKLIFSINTIVNLEIIDNKNEEVLNNIYLYPHKYIRLFPERNHQIKNADLLRVSLSTGLDYFNDKIIINSEINNKFKEKIIWKDNEINEEISKLFLYLYKSNLRESTILEWLKTDKFWNIVWENLIKKYNDLFLNRDKKIIYYKNTIIRSLWDLVNSEKIENSKNDFLISSLYDLKNIDENWYNEMKVIIEYYSSIIINWNKKDINSKINFSKIYNKINWKEYKFDNDNNLILNDIFFNFDFLNEDNLYTKLKIFNENNIKNKLSEWEKSYFMFFLNKIITYWLDEIVKNNNIKIEDILSILNIYVDLSINFYNKEEEVIIRTWINEYNDLTKIILERINDLFFTRNNETLLLERKKEYVITNQDINILDKSLNRIFNYYKNNKLKVPNTQNNIPIKESIEKNIELFEEYILALKDENRYIATYNEKIKELVFWWWVKQEKQVLSTNNAKEYLSKFKHINIENAKIEIKNYDYCMRPNDENNLSNLGDPYCYEIKNLEIWDWSKLISFLLHPFNFNNINNFDITLRNWEKEINNWSYRLDNIKIDLDEKFLVASNDEDREKFDFYNFFLNNFLRNQQILIWNNDNLNNITNNIEESEIVKFIKRNRLLWANWTLTAIKSRINIEYNSIFVKEIDNSNFDIEILWWKLNFTNENNFYKWDFNSKYLFTPNNSFLNPNIKLYDSRDNILLNWNEVNIIWEIKLEELEEVFWLFFSKINDLTTMLLIFNNTLSLNQFNIDYLIENNTYIIQNNQYKVIIWDWEVKSLTKDSKSLINNSMPINRINDILILNK